MYLREVINFANPYSIVLTSSPLLYCFLIISPFFLNSLAFMTSNFKSAFWNGGKVKEAEWSLFPTNMEYETKEAFVSRRVSECQIVLLKCKCELSCTNANFNFKNCYGIRKFFSDYKLVCYHAKSLLLCLTLFEPVDCSPPGSSVHGILQARILE